VQYKDGVGIRTFSMLWRKSFPITQKLSFQPMLYGRFVLGGEKATFLLRNMMGGEWYGHYLEQQMPFAGIGRMESVNNQYVAAQLQAQQRIGDKHYVLLRFAAGQKADKLRKLSDYRTMIGFQASYYYNSLFGPAGASLGYSNHTKSAYIFVNLGYVF
jgi:NTE family protein